MQRPNTPIFAALLIATTAGSAAGQITIPPTAARPDRPAYVPRAERANQQQQQQAEAATKSNFDPTSVEYTPVYTVADDGSIIGPIEHYEIMALRNNPLIDDDLWDFLDVLLADREEEMEIVAHVYPRVCIDAVTTVIPGFDIVDESTRIPLGDITNAINQPTGLIAWLQTQGVLTAEMQQMSHHISTDYTQAAMTNLKETAPSDFDELQITNLQARFLVRQGLAEPLRGFGRLARRVIIAHPGLVENQAELLELQGDAFVDAVAKALSVQTDEELMKLFLEAHENG